MLQSFAHIKWFVDSKEILEGQSATYQWSVAQVLVIATVLALIIGIGVYVERFFPKPPKKMLKFVEQKRPLIMRLFTGFIGIFLIVISFFWSVILTPELSANQSAFTQILRAVQILCGLFLIAGYMQTWAAKALGALYVVTGLLVGPVFFLENLLLLGAAIYIYTYYTESKSFKKKWDSWALPILRVTTGVSLIAFAFSEKLIHPQLSEVFLSNHSWNFLGNVLSNQTFILTAGVVEVLFGLLFITGVATRITTLCIAGLFATSVVTMLITKGQWEVEDLPVYAVAIVLFAYGSGSRLRINKTTK